MNQNTKALLSFIEQSPSSFHAVDNIAQELKEAGYIEVFESKPWQLEVGKGYYVTRNASSIIAFRIPKKMDDINFQIIASHSDSPSYKVKPNATITIKDTYQKLNTEGYGGMIASSWFDRPLSIAGRLIVKDGNQFKTKLIDIDEDLLMIPNLAIHMNRDVNNGYKYNPQIDMLPLFGTFGGTTLEDKITQYAKCDREAILDHDLFLYNRQKGCVWGSDQEFVSMAKLDDLECAYTSLQALIHSKNDQSVNIFVCFDNEEVGSSTKQGADGTFLRDVIERIGYNLSLNDEELKCAIASSFMLSADNAHSLHPNHADKNDPTNSVFMNQGIVIKYSARQAYTSDAMSAAIFMDICERANVPYQKFVNRSDMPGGGTLGNVSSHQLSIPTCDIGLAQLAMHSAYESAGVKDIEYMINALTMFYNTHISGIDNTTLAIHK